ncbi:hypothetical protein K470DRAFT_255758 [Piedraia hortae CBS 480.64]|uniref:Sas10 C-terminal domain-containing protein n=1 Tax=Piedraia hortae CBS 480.64 TaxID=1314780 RepID=A0A6A7C878_9PEZI|nr:hypothetical protein K470DRAFT_255758 [Piedraia hortae CBS 480.64]
MAKRKRSTRAPTPSEPNIDVDDSRKGITDFRDVADSEDEFFLGRDEVPLQGPEAKRRKQKEEEDNQLSDEEVLDYSGEEQEAGESDGEDEEEWGVTNEALYGANEIETEEQAFEEEREAIKLQKKTLQQMQAEDFAFDPHEWGQADAEPEPLDAADPQTDIPSTDGLSEAEKLKLLKSFYPEFIPLSKELLHMEQTSASLETGSTRARAAAAYRGALQMYFLILMSSTASGDAPFKAMPPSQLRQHPIMDTLERCRETWLNVQNLRQEHTSSKPVYTLQEPVVTEPQSDDTAAEPKQPKKKRAEKAARAAKGKLQPANADRLAKTEADLAALDSLLTTNRPTKRRVVAHASEIGDEEPLNAHEAQERANRKKSLRFYTSHIAQKAYMREANSRNAGGDDDLPYRERLRDRQARLNAEAEKRGRRTANTDADMGASSDGEEAVDNAGEDDYYQLIASRSSRKKASKAALAEVHKNAALQGGRVVEEEIVDPDGKRKITYNIEKNKGLTPHRKKEVRNPRVRRRVKYGQKQKKISSMKPIYKGGEGRGGYAGELTGIKKNLVKSTKL